MNSHKLDTKRSLLARRCLRIRRKVKGTSDRPRLSLKLTNKHIYAQAIDDTKGVTLYYISTLNLDEKLLPNIAGAAKLGETLGAEVLKKGVKQVVFDRNGRRYHGVVKSFADAVRKAGVQF
jgi:large subunit ribosomal protein L18